MPNFTGFAIPTEIKDNLNATQASLQVLCAVLARMEVLMQTQNRLLQEFIDGPGIEEK